MLSAPQQQPSVVEQAQQHLNSLQQQSTAAFTDLNTKFLQTTGIENNVALVNAIEQQRQSLGTQIQGKLNIKLFKVK